MPLKRVTNTAPLLKRWVSIPKAWIGSARCLHRRCQNLSAVGIPEDFTTLGVKKEDVDQLADLAMIDVCTLVIRETRKSRYG